MDSPKSWKCGPGLKDSLVQSFRSVIGDPNLIPIFKAVQYPELSNGFTYVAAESQGQNAYYRIVGFVGVTVSNVGPGDGNNLVFSAKPMGVVDPTAVIPNLMPAGTQASPATPSTASFTTITTFGSAKLTY